MNRRRINKQQHAGGVKRDRSDARLGGRAAAMAGPHGEPSGKRRSRAHGQPGPAQRTEERPRQSDRQTLPHQRPPHLPPRRHGGARPRGHSRRRTRLAARPSSHRRHDWPPRVQRTWRLRYMNRGACRKSRQAICIAGRNRITPEPRSSLPNRPRSTPGHAAPSFSVSFTTCRWHRAEQSLA